MLIGGTGIGRVTKPGLAVPQVGEWAINPVPRRMIMEVVKEVLAMRRYYPPRFSLVPM